MLADQLDYVVGVDPHRDSHALAVVHVLSGAVVMETTVTASGDGYAQALKLVEVHAPGRRAFAVEGTGSFGAGLTRFLTGRGERVLEVSRLRRERRSGGKTDALDAIRAARSVLAQERPATPRAGGERLQPRTAHDPRHPQALTPRHDRLHRTAPPRGQDATRSNPLPQALPRPQPLPPTRTRTAAGDLTDIEASLEKLPIVQVIDRAGQLASEFSGRNFVLALRE
jgi:hypothetical protein